MGMHPRFSFAASYAFITQTMNMFMHMRPIEMLMQHISKGKVKVTEGPCMRCGRGGRARHNQRTPGKDTTGKGHIPGVICMHGT